MTRPLPRRTLLRGALATGAVALALPPLEAMFGTRGAQADDLGPIFGVFFWANGLPWHAGHGAEQAAGLGDEWTPANTGSGYTPSPLLAPLASHQVTVVTGLEPHTDIPNDPPGQSDGHMRGFMVGLTSDRPRPEGFNHASHTLTALRPSLDQYVARHDDFYGDYPPRYRSLVLGASETRFHDYGHWNSISYNGPDSLNPAITDPGQLYDLLFAVPADPGGLTRRAKLLDAVMDDAKSLRARLGAADRQRLDSHLEHLHEVQRRLELGTQTCSTTLPKPGNTQNLLDKTAIMAELLALGLGCGITRVFSFMLTSPASTHVFDNVPGVIEEMHKTCHDGKWTEVRGITLFQMECFARFLEELAAVVDPEGVTLLDRALVYGTSEYGEGWKHGNKETPIVLAGRANGKLQHNTHLREPDGNISKAHVTLLRALGITTPSFGFNGAETSEAFDGLLL
jgi:hypothetical protein